MMKQMLCLAVSIIFVLGHVGMVMALSGTSETIEKDPDLMIVFGAPPEFDVTQGEAIPAPEDGITEGDDLLIGTETGGTSPDLSAIDPDLAILETQQDSTVSPDLLKILSRPQQQESSSGKDPIPEPSTLVLLGLGLLGLIGWMRRR